MMKLFSKLHKDVQGVSFLMLSYICFSLLNIISKQLYGLKMDPTVITFYRSFFCILITTPFAIMVMKNQTVKFAKINIYKGVIDFLSIPIWVMAVSYMKIPEAVGITYLTPILTAIMAVIFLKDKINIQKWLVMFIGLIGAYIILKPDFDNFNYYSFYALAACLLWATGGILTKNLTNNQHPIIIVFFTNIVIASFATPVFITNLYFLNAHEAVLCLMMSTAAATGYLCLSYAYKSTKLSNLLPYDYFRLIFATITSYIFLGQVIDGSTIVGSALIFGSSIYLARKQIIKAKELNLDRPGLGLKK